MNVNLNIERVVLEGVTPHPDQQQRLAAELERELALFISASLGERSGLESRYREALTGQMVAVTERGEPMDLGRQVARSVYGEIGQ